jgi:hypothetical protein
VIPLLAFLLILTGCSQEAKAPEPKADPTRVEVPLPPPRREEIKQEMKKPSYYQTLDERLDKLQGQLEWAQKRVGGP